MRIKLTQGKFAEIDDADYELVKDRDWHAVKQRNGTWYACARNLESPTKAKLRMHRLILGAGPGQWVDHRDGDGLRNTRDNLRLCTNQENQQNTDARGGSSRFKGVSWNARCGKWVVQFRALGCLHYLGYFTDEEEAARAYDARVRSLPGAEFFRYNFPEPGERSTAA